MNENTVRIVKRTKRLGLPWKTTIQEIALPAFILDAAKEFLDEIKKPEEKKP